MAHTGITKAVLAGLGALLLVLGSCQSPRYTLQEFWEYSFSSLQTSENDMVLVLDWASQPTLCRSLLDILPRLAGGGLETQTSLLGDSPGLGTALDLGAILDQPELGKRLGTILICRHSPLPGIIPASTLVLANIDAPGFLLEEALVQGGFVRRGTAPWMTLATDPETPDSQGVMDYKNQVLWTLGGRLWAALPRRGLLALWIPGADEGFATPDSGDPDPGLAGFAPWVVAASALEARPQPRDAALDRADLPDLPWYRRHLAPGSFLMLHLALDGSKEALIGARRVVLGLRPAGTPDSTVLRLVLQAPQADGASRLRQRFKVLLFGLGNLLPPEAGLRQVSLVQDLEQGLVILDQWELSNDMLLEVLALLPRILAF